MTSSLTEQQRRACEGRDPGPDPRVARGCTSRWNDVVLVVALLFVAPSHAAQFAFAAFGDTPYNADEESRIVNLIAQINAEPLALVVHVGDFKDARTACTDELFMERREWFSLSHHPFVFIPGDNEWSDCWRPFRARRDPVGRLNKLRELFFAGDMTLGQRPLAVARQRDRGYPEHLRWTVEDVLFFTLNIPGPDNNARMPQESRQRTAAILDWMRDAFRIGREKKLPALVMMTQANLWSGNSAFDPMLDLLASEARTYSGEVLVVHGDTHWYRYDQPLSDRRTGKAVTNVSRLEVMGSPFFDWVYVTVRTGEGKARFAVERGSDVTTSRNR